MARRAYTGFDALPNVAALDGIGTVTGSPTLQSGLVSGGQALRLPATGATFTFPCQIATNRVVVHFRWRLSQSTNNSVFLELRNSSGEVIFNVRTGTSFAWEFRNGTTVLLTVPDAYAAGVTAHWVIDVVLGDGTAGAITVFRDGVQVGFVEDVDTRAFSGDVATIRLTGAFNMDWDDIVVDDAERLGTVRVLAATVDADIGTPDWTQSTGGSRFGVLDELPSNGDTDYCSSTTPGDLMRLGITPGLQGFRIDSVRSFHVSREEEVSTSEVEITAFSGAADDGGRTSNLTVTHRMFQGPIMDVDPDTSAAWDPDDLDDLEILLEHVTV